MMMLMMIFDCQIPWHCHFVSETTSILHNLPLLLLEEYVESMHFHAS